VPVFKAFMDQALKDQPIVPFRMPKGIRNVQINAETGVRSRPGDKKVIWESFVNGTEPTDEMYILDGEGISVMPSYSMYSYDYQYDQPAEAPRGQGEGKRYTRPAPSQPSSVITGTGGLY